MRLECGPEAEVIGKGAALFYPAEAVAQGKPREDLAEARRLGRLSAEDWRRRKDGSEFLAHVTITPLYDDSGRLRGYGKVVRDITEERARSEESSVGKEGVSRGRSRGSACY